MTNLPLATIPGTEVHMLHSTVANQDYLISVALPFGYDEHPNKRYPVLYVLDGNLYFGMVVDMVRAMNIRVPFCNELPDAFIVGIGYPVTGSLTERLHQVMHLRMRDLDPNRDEGGDQFMQEYFPVPNPLASGGGAHFLQFIHQELGQKPSRGLDVLGRRALEVGIRRAPPQAFEQARDKGLARRDLRDPSLEDSRRDVLSIHLEIQEPGGQLLLEGFQ